MNEEYEALKRQREAELEADALKALEEAKSRAEKPDYSDLDARIRTQHEQQIPRGTEAARDFWEQHFASKEQAGE